MVSDLKASDWLERTELMHKWGITVFGGPWCAVCVKMGGLNVKLTYKKKDNKNKNYPSKKKKAKTKKKRRIKCRARQ